jgi:hypothetical protein
MSSVSIRAGSYALLGGRRGQAPGLYALYLQG